MAAAEEVPARIRRGVLHARRAGPYALGEPLAWGADFTTRVVRRGRHDDTGEEVAVKVLCQSELAAPAFPAAGIAAFKRDLLLLRDGLQGHAGIVSVHDTL